LRAISPLKVEGEGIEEAGGKAGDRTEGGLLVAETSEDNSARHQHPAKILRF